MDGKKVEEAKLKTTSYSKSAKIVQQEKPLSNARDKTQMASDLSVYNKALRSAAESYMKQRKAVNDQKNEITRMKSSFMQATVAKGEKALKDARLALEASSEKFVTSYNILQETFDSCFNMRYRKEHKDAKNSLAEFAPIISGLTLSLEVQQSQDMLRDGHEERRNEASTTENIEKKKTEQTVKEQLQSSTTRIVNLDEENENYEEGALDHVPEDSDENISPVSSSMEAITGCVENK